MYGLTRRMGGVDDEHVSDAERLVLHRHGFKLRYLANEINVLCFNRKMA